MLTGCIGNGEHLPIVFIEGNLDGAKYLWYLMEYVKSIYQARLEFVSVP